MDHSKKITYLFSIDALRVLSILAVILIHTSTKSLQSINHDVSIAPLTLFLNQASRFAVPLFFLISGFVLELNYNKSYSYVEFFKKRASRVLLPFISWSLIYALIGGGFSFENIVLGKASYHLYFIPTLILFYLLFPFLHKVIHILKKPVTLTIILVIQTALLYYDYYITRLQFQDIERIAILSFGMFVIGMIASHGKDGVLILAKKYFTLLITTTTVLALLIFWHVYTLTERFDTTRFIYNQHSPLNYLFTVILAVTACGYLESSQKMRKYFILFSKLSFFVFFIHVLVLTYVWQGISFFINPAQKSLGRILFLDPIFFLLVTFISFGIAYFVHKIPHSSKVLG